MCATHYVSTGKPTDLSMTYFQPALREEFDSASLIAAACRAPVMAALTHPLGRLKQPRAAGHKSEIHHRSKPFSAFSAFSKN